MLFNKIYVMVSEGNEKTAVTADTPPDEKTLAKIHLGEWTLAREYEPVGGALEVLQALGDCPEKTVFILPNETLAVAIYTYFCAGWNCAEGMVVSAKTIRARFKRLTVGYLRDCIVHRTERRMIGFLIRCLECNKIDLELSTQDIEKGKMLVCLVSAFQFGFVASSRDMID